MYSIIDIKRLRSISRGAKLKSSPKMRKMPLKSLCIICNGVGRADSPKWLRDTATRFFGAIESTAAIHDFDYSQSDGNESTRYDIDLKFLENGLKEIKYNYGRLSFFRYWEQLKCFLAWQALQKNGSKAWLKCFKVNKKNKK